ncbi:MAG: SpoIIIAH-like family protein, partial [Oscillospiraceae bacterium]
MNKIIGKKQIIMAALVLGLGAAVYLNWQYADIGKEMAASKTETVKNYGDAKYVDDKVLDAENEAYFAEAKLTRTKSRDEAVATLKDMLADSTLAVEQKADLANKATEFAKSIEVEGKIENLIKAKGFTDCMVYYDNDQDRVDVVIKTQGLLDDETAQIWDIVSKETNVASDKVSII